MVRAAVFSDVHGNLVALDAVLSAAAADNVDEYWIIGDHVAHGPQPAEVIDRIKQLPSVRAVRGNTDRYVLDRSRSSLIPTVSPGMSAEEVQLLVDAEASHAWTRGAVTARGHWDWLAELQVEERAQLPDGTSVLLVHASPGRDDGPGITAEQSAQELLDDLGFQDCGATLVFTGHTHWPCDRQLLDVRAVNVGSVSLPYGQHRGATWSLLTAGPSGYQVQHRVETYSFEEVHRAIDLSHHPTPEWLKSKFHSEAAGDGG